MTLRRGFKKKANVYARQFRAELGLKPHAPLSPWSLAKHLAILVIPVSELRNTIPEAVRYVTQQDPKCFSAITVINDSQRLIVYNDAHHPHRQASNIAHEESHGILQHPPMPPFNEYGCRNFKQDFEDEANWLGPALLISEEAALYIVEQEMSIDEAVKFYNVTKEVITMRINVTGARQRIARRLKTY